ncbi:MAG: hypothetical protein NTX49_06980 [Chlamydiae bacterium]|nr:hypothetical protein [Chlamydiota bacterium]
MVTHVSTATYSSYIEIPLVLTMHQQERICAMQKSLSLVIGEERDELVAAIRDFLGAFTAAAKEQIIAKYFEAIRSEIS